MIATAARRGYRFAQPVRVRDAAVAEDPSAERYVGRANLLARVSEMLGAALSGRGRILFLAGEAGIGKTRTAEVLAERARRAGAAVATAWGAEADAPAYWSWTRTLRGLAQLVPDGVTRLSLAQRTALSPLLPELGGVGIPPRARPGRELSARAELFEAVQALLVCCAASRPLALFLDDLHVAGAESLALLEFVGETLGTVPIAIVATCREDEATRAPQAARALERLLRLHVLERWPLAGLCGEEIHEFVRAQHGAEPDPALIRALERLTGGNPLLLGESLRSLEARGLLGQTREAKEWEALLPRGIVHLLSPKLQRLSAGAADALRCAAAIGVEIERDLLARCQPDASDLDARLRELEDAALLCAAGSSSLRLRFAHALVRNALYDELVPAGAGRRTLHARIAAALPAEGSSADAIAERAHHACEAAPLVVPARAAALAPSRRRRRRPPVRLRARRRVVRSRPRDARARARRRSGAGGRAPAVTGRRAGADPRARPWARQLPPRGGARAVSRPRRPSGAGCARPRTRAASGELRRTEMGRGARRGAASRPER